MTQLTLCISLLAAVGSCLGGIVTSFEELPSLTYDFVVVGGGTSGLVIANRLTENPKHNVLVLEAGGSNANILNGTVPFYCTRMTPRTPYDWNFTTVAQTGLLGRTIPYSRGFILGGSSSVNFMGYTRGSSDDYDRYARITGDQGWSWKNLQPYFRKNERWTEPADHHDTAGQFNPKVHGYNGVNGVSLPGFPQPIDSRVLQAAEELGGDFSYNIDTNSGHQLGIGWTQSTIQNGERSSSATSYLGPQYITRKNLHVVLHARVSRVYQSGLKKNQPFFSIVEFTDNGGGFSRNVTASKEIVLSAGSIMTPHILLNSGIGDSSALSLIGVKPVLNLPSVGQNLSDHPMLGNRWLVNSTDTFEAQGRNATLAAEQLAQWQATRTGPLVDGTFNQVGWIRLPKAASIFRTVPDPAAGPHTAHIEILMTNGISRPPFPETGNFLNIGNVVLSPTSRGSVTLNSSNPFDPPNINPNFLATEYDMFTMREAIRAARRFTAAPAWADYIISATFNGTTDAELDQYIRSNAGSIFHPVGTAAMSHKGAKYGVVDPDLKVKGTFGIRIVDASVLPLLPAAHTQAAVYVIAERAADLIKSSW